MTLADKIVVLRDGRVEQVGSPQELYQRPATRFVAGFIGSPTMNFMPAELLGGDDEGCRIKAPGLGELTLPQDAGGQSRGTGLSLGVRPEHLSLAEARETTPSRSSTSSTWQRGLRLSGAQGRRHLVDPSQRSPQPLGDRPAGGIGARTRARSPVRHRRPGPRPRQATPGGLIPPIPPALPRTRRLPGRDTFDTYPIRTGGGMEAPTTTNKMR